jgi:hypothetical protein
MAKPFNEIETDAEYLRAVGMGPETHPKVWDCFHYERRNGEYSRQFYRRDEPVYVGQPLSLHDTDPARKWDNLANVLRVLGPEMDRRGWLMWHKDHKNYSDVTLFDKHGAMPGDGCAALPHLALLKAFYNAHAQGETA